MRKLTALIMGASLVCVGLTCIAAQAPSGPPKPGPQHEKLAYFVGKWTSEGDMKPSPFGPGGKFTFAENCEWFSGKFALICHSEGAMTGVAVQSLSVMGYDNSAKDYIYFETNNLGENTVSHGNVAADTWTWTSEGSMEGKPYHSRFTLKQLSPEASSYKFEMASGADPLAVVMEGKQTRQK